MTLLTYLPREMRLGFVNDMPAGRRKRTLQRFLNYPAHSVGTLVSSEFAAAYSNKPASEVVSELKALADPVTVVVHDINGRYLGLMNPQRALVGEGRGAVGDYLESLDPLLAESPLLEACDARQWSRSPVLAVVDHDRRILGVVSSDRVLTAVAEMGLHAEPRPAVLADLVDLYLGVLASLLALLLSSRNAR
jgi:Mg/Co/Ni transporter MgtE